MRKSNDPGKVAIVTYGYPFGAGEQFLGPEIAMWSRAGHEVILLPLTAEGHPRSTPPGIMVDTCLSTPTQVAAKASPVALAAALVDRSTWHEIKSVGARGRFGSRRVAEVFSTEAQVRRLARGLQHAAIRHGGFDVTYSYWHGAAAYGAVLARQRGATLGKLVSRAHRVDLYEEFRTSGHHPRKRHYGPDIDINAAISSEGAAYLNHRYSITRDSIEVARLGCVVDGHVTPPTDPGELHVISASYVKPVKRVPEIFQAMEALAKQLPETAVRWTHFGAGPGFADLRARTRKASANNLSVYLPGQVDHAELLAHLRRHPIDMFVNFSISEGVPVSIMEAMSVGIPAIAPSVGGVPELIESTNGVLLTATSTVDELTAGLLALSSQSKSTVMRSNAAAKVAADYDSDKNFTTFIKMITA